MTCLYWNGTAYVDATPARLGVSNVTKQAWWWDSTASVMRLLWTKPMNLRAYKTGTQIGVGNSYNAITNMIADATYPDTVMSGNAIVVPPGTPSVNALITLRCGYSGGSVPSVNARIRKNGVDLVTSGTGSGGVAQVSTTTPIVGGDVIEGYWRGEGQFFSYPTLQAEPSTWLAVSTV